ncbi:hypothetical protein WMY93_003819 [Mugilogobius chulae]|uniref:Glucosidase 2 subunit beta n=1 Tax=Mugilogobius chulae TaxID=88201 RepID=A0AAW0PXV0_9GOBI
MKIMRCHCFVLLLLAVGISAVEVQRPRGVPLSKRPLYEEGKPFTCLDGSRTIPFNRVNDDYCDCQDGSDEPGTSACPNGHFHCTNAGFRPTFIPSLVSMMGFVTVVTPPTSTTVVLPVKTPARSWDERERRPSEISRNKKAKLAEVEVSKKGMEVKVESLRSVKEEAEKPEKEAKERHLKAWEEQKAVIRMEKDKAKMAEVFAELDDDADGSVSVAELLTHSELDPDSDGSFTEVEAQVLLGVDKVDIAAFEMVWNSIKEKYISEARADTSIDIPQEEIKEPATDQESEPYPDEDIPEEDDDEEDDEDDEDSDDYKSPPTTHTQEKKADEDDEGTMPPYDEETQQLIDVAQKARDEFDEAERALREVDDQIRNIEKEISFDFGPSAEFGYMYSQCYELTTGEYVYKLCPFNRVSQKPKFGGSETNLGTWGKWAGPEDDIYSVMKYEHGTGCWQGPNRSTTVKLTCGKETVVTSTSEPSRCEYLMEFTTPAICKEPKSVDMTDEHDEL